MKNTTIKKTADDPSLWLKEFDIEVSSGSERVYNNGRQQIKISLIVEPRSGQEVTDAQFSTLMPVYRDNDGSFVTLPQDHSADGWFYSVEEDLNYDYFPSTASVEPMKGALLNADGSQNTLLVMTPQGHWKLDEQSPPGHRPQSNPVLEKFLDAQNRISAARRVKTFYIHTKARAGTTVTLYARIEKDAETIYTSDEAESEIKLYSEPTRQLIFPEDYDLSKKIISESLSATPSERDPERFIYEFSLKPKYIDFSSAKYESNASESRGMIKWQDHSNSQPRATHVGVAFPGSRNVNYNDTLTLGGQFPPRKVKQISDDNTGKIVVLMQGDNQIPYHSADYDKQGPMKIQALDRFGTQHTLAIRFDESQDSAFDKRSNLTVESRTESHVDTHTAAEEFVSITHFQVKGLNSNTHKQSCRLYNNGWQQTYINVVITATNERNEQVELSDGILNKIQLVDYDTGADLSPSAYTITRTQSEIDKLFHIIPASVIAKETTEAPINDQAATPAQGGQSITFWVRTKAVTNKTIAARLVHDGVTYHTYQRDVAPGGETRSGNSNSAAEISPLEQNYHYTAKNFILTRTNASDDLRSDIIDIDLYKLKINSAEHHITSSDYEPAVWMFDYIAGKKANSLAYFRRNNTSTTVTLYYHLNYQPIAVNRTVGEANAVRVKSNSLGPDGESYVGVLMVYRDQYGNGHNVWLNPASEANLITIS
ncbi:hypothetical protein [Pseudomonas sp. H9]|uniref:hypothetical protein n=1 Tax=Pseudomonas sp. H9 TaxID=483968 RepID=UPI001058346A|nr:hypothetical protein [Pseudomonas sp. H9]TDF81797.1 hypothetical protein E1573_16915 [Pseudomonas sp. H9]